MTSLEELKKAGDDALLKRHQLQMARIELAKWQARLALGQFRTVRGD